MREGWSCHSQDTVGTASTQTPRARRLGARLRFSPEAAKEASSRRIQRQVSRAPRAANYSRSIIRLGTKTQGPRPARFRLSKGLPVRKWAQARSVCTLLWRLRGAASRARAALETLSETVQSLRSPGGVREVVDAYDQRGGDASLAETSARCSHAWHLPQHGNLPVWQGESRAARPRKRGLR